MRCTGDNWPLRTWLEQEEIAYVLAVACDHRVPAGAGRTIRADQLAARLPKKAWQRLSAGKGAKGHRWYDWAWVVKITFVILIDSGLRSWCALALCACA
jgi:hypothetical protein